MSLGEEVECLTASIIGAAFEVSNILGHFSYPCPSVSNGFRLYPYTNCEISRVTIGWAGGFPFSMRTEDENRKMDWNRRFFLLLALVTAWRLVYLLVAPLDLAADEAYYWDWSRQLDWGYFSKPPMVAWIIALFSRTIAPVAAVVRLPAVLLGAVSALMIFLLARRMYDSRTAFWAAAALMASPGAAALGFFMTIDAPLICFWSTALYLLWVGLEGEDAGVMEWVALAAAIGLGMLSKQVMAGFIGLMFVFLAVSGRDRPLLKSSRPYLVSLLALAALIPPVVWNARHGWVTLHHTAGHFERGPSHLIATFTEFIGGQMVIVSPLTWVLFAVLYALLLVRFRAQDRSVRYLLTFSVVPLLGVLVLSLRQRVEANWPAAFYPAAMVLLAAWGCGNVSAGPRLDSWRPYFKKAVMVGAAMVLLTYALPFWAGAVPAVSHSPAGGPTAPLHPPAGSPAAPLHPLAGGLTASLHPSAGGPTARLMARVQGWRQLGLQTGRALGAVPRPESTFILTFDRQLAAELAFYVPGQPRVYSWRGPEGLPDNQYDIWDGPKIGRDALMVFPDNGVFGPAAVSGYFQTVSRLDNISSGDGSGRDYCVYFGTSLKKSPAGNR